MFENVNNIIIKSSHFLQSTVLANVLDKRINLLFGRNGSGKSTIARAMSELADPTLVPELRTFEIIELDRPLSDENKKSIFVFNEDFIEKHVKVEDDELGPIVMLGDQVDIAEKISSKTKEIEKLQGEYDELKAMCEKLSDDNNESSPKHKFKYLKYKLNAKDSWAERDNNCKIKAAKYNSAITNETIHSLYDTLLANTLSEDEYEEKSIVFKREYGLFKQSADKVVLTFNDLSVRNSIDIEHFQKILSRHVQKPKLNNREQKLINIVANQLDKLYDSQKIFSDDKTDVCPFCFRPISADEKSSLCDSIEHILNHEVEEYKQTITELVESMQDVTYSYDALESLFRRECDVVKQAIIAYNNVLETLRKIVAKRLDSLFDEFTDDIRVLGMDNRISELNTALNNLYELVCKYNAGIKERKNISDDLRKQNDILAANKFRNDIKDYILVDQSLNDCKEQLQTKERELNEAKKEFAALNQILEQTHTALDFINDCMAYIYFSKSRLVLKESDKGYRLMSNGVDVKPGKVSVGERNIIGLCYYFANLFDHVKKEDWYKKEMLLIIDDPISSFDFDNKMGVLSFLRWQIDKVYNGNPKSKILIMSHDLMAIFDIQKMVSEITDKSKNNYIELVDKKAIVRKSSFGNEYAWMFKKVFDFASQNDIEKGDDVHTIGNIMRRLLEAFFTFNYRQAFYNFVCKEEFLVELPECKRNYYGNLMTRLVLNGCSHEEESIKALGDMFLLFTPSEMQVTAKSILSMIYILNGLHVRQYLGDDAIKTIQKWQESQFDEV